MKFNKRKMITLAVTLLLAVIMCPVMAFAAEEVAEYTPKLYATFWALVPPMIAIALALITKEVYSSLFVGILVGGLFYSGFSFEGTILHIYNNGFVASLTSTGNVGILIFLVLLGTIVALMNKAGGSAAFGRWAGEHIKSKTGAQLATIALGVLIFIDDYFNCLTVGSVMQPVTDKHKISRAKFAYLIDATAAPICIIAPISSWAAAVSGCVNTDNGFTLFIQAIPYNFYALLTLIMMITMVVLKIEFGPMAKHEANAVNGDLFTTTARPYTDTTTVNKDAKGKVIDLLLPIISLIVCCIIGMIYTGGFFSGTNIITAFSNCSASVGLALGSFFGFLITVILYLIRKVLSFKDCMDCLAEGFKAMVPAILILVCAWTLNSMTSSLGAADFVATAMESSAAELEMLLPAIIFLVGCLLSFATGTSWGTFSILIPIVVAVFENSNYELMVIAISACMAGAVCGDHCSPISDTTIMASAGAQCDHVSHVNTQLPYVIVAAAVSFVAYIIAGFIQSAWIALPIAIAMMIGILMLLRFISKSSAQ
ncbi:MAG: Na+/H+ antiporter NhaC family protein [Lachnospiraceae bacterium]|nr:Na+/H+ antiporter NhaC family protein [Lachnospiraceae bacterium]